MIKHIKHAKSDKGQNENLDRFLGEESLWMGLAAHIRLCPDTQKFLILTHLVIANVMHLHKNDVKFKCGRGSNKWVIFFKTDRNRGEEFAKPQDLYKWLQSQENVVKFIDSRVVAAPITPSDNSLH